MCIALTTSFSASTTALAYTRRGAVVAELRGGTGHVCVGHITMVEPAPRVVAVLARVRVGVELRVGVEQKSMVH